MQREQGLHKGAHAAKRCGKLKSTTPSGRKGCGLTNTAPVPRQGDTARQRRPWRRAAGRAPVGAALHRRRHRHGCGAGLCAGAPVGRRVKAGSAMTGRAALCRKAPECICAGGRGGRPAARMIWRAALPPGPPRAQADFHIPRRCRTWAGRPGCSPPGKCRFCASSVFFTVASSPFTSTTAVAPFRHPASGGR